MILDRDSISDFDHLRVDVTTSATQLVATAHAQGSSPRAGVRLKADIANTGVVYVGKSDVTAGTVAATDGYPLSAGEEVAIPIDDATKLYGRSSAGTNKIYVLWI